MESSKYSIPLSVFWGLLVGIMINPLVGVWLYYTMWLNDLHEKCRGLSTPTNTNHGVYKRGANEDDICLNLRDA